MKLYQKVIALGADIRYMDKVETVIKSISVHNQEVKFYVFNDDLPSEWFLLMRNRLKTIGSEIVNVKTAHNLRDFHLPNAILSYAAFFRYFIADEVQRRQSSISRLGYDCQCKFR